MYLTKRVFIGAQYETRGITGTIALKAKGEPIKVNKKRVSYIIEDAGYWRKANAIHQWFVTNVQDGKDDCGEYYVTEDKLRQLLELCNRVLAASKPVKGKVTNGYRITAGGEQVPILEDGETIEDSSVAEELLPTQGGFFFGSTEYNQYYLEDIRNTKKIIEDALKDAGEGVEFYYSASW